MATTIRFGTSVITNATLEDTNLLNLGDGNTELTGANHHIQNRNLYAYVDTASGGAAAINNQFHSAAMAGAEFAQKIADMGNGGRTLDIGAENTADDIVRITSHGLINNNEFGDLTTAHGGVSFHGDAAGFGVDNAPESGGRWINTADAIDFAVESWDGQKQAIKTFSFTVDVNGAGSRNLVIDFDGNVAVKTGTGQLVGSLATKAALDGFVLGAFSDGDTVTLNFDAKTISVNGGPATALSAAITDAFEEAGVDNVTIGAERTDGLGFSLAHVAIGTVDSFGPGGPGGFGDEGAPVLSFDMWINGQGSRITGFVERELYAYLDANGNNMVDAGEVASAERLGQQGLGQNGDPNGDGDDNITQGVGTTDWVDIYALGVDVASPAAAFQYGDFMASDLNAGGTFRFGVDTAGNPGTISYGPDGQPTDVAASPGNWGDASGGATVDRGETLGFILRAQDAAAVRIAYDMGQDSNVATTADLIVRLYQGGTLIETFTHDITGATGEITVTDNLFQSFDRVEIQAAGAKPSGAVVPVVDWAEFRVTDLDFFLV